MLNYILRITVHNGYFTIIIYIIITVHNSWEFLMTLTSLGYNYSPDLNALKTI